MQLYIGAETLPTDTPDLSILQVAALAVEERHGEIASFQGTCEWMSDSISKESREKCRRRNDIMVGAVASNLRTFLDSHPSGDLHAWKSDVTKAFFSGNPWSIGHRQWGECVSFAAGMVMNAARGVRHPEPELRYPDLAAAVHFFQARALGGSQDGVLYRLRLVSGIHSKVIDHRQSVEVDDEISYALEHGIY